MSTPSEKEDQSPYSNKVALGDEIIFSESPLYLRVLKRLVAAFVIIGLIYLSGVYQYFFYRKTPASIEQQAVASAIDAEKLIIPLTIFILDNDGANGSNRDEENARRLVREASRIWGQASIELKLQNIHVLHTTDKDIDVLYQSPRVFMQSIEQFDPNTINIFLVGYLQGINGIAFGGTNAVAVADYTTVYDFRTLAHEVGHTMGLDHISDTTGNLMYQGANGFMLSIDEIMHARATAERLFKAN